MRRRTGGSLLRTATSELTPLTAARLSALQQPRLPDVDEDRPGAWANQVVARSPSLYIHARRACDARTVFASTSMVRVQATGAGRASARRLLSMAATPLSCFRWRARPFRSRQLPPAIVVELQLHRSTLLWRLRAAGFVAAEGAAEWEARWCTFTRCAHIHELKKHRESENTHG